MVALKRRTLVRTRADANRRRSVFADARDVVPSPSMHRCAADGDVARLGVAKRPSALRPTFIVGVRAATFPRDAARAAPGRDGSPHAVYGAGFLPNANGSVVEPGSSDASGFLGDSSVTHDLASTAGSQKQSW